MRAVRDAGWFADRPPAPGPPPSSTPPSDDGQAGIESRTAQHVDEHQDGGEDEAQPQPAADERAAPWLTQSRRRIAVDAGNDRLPGQTKFRRHGLRGVAARARAHRTRPRRAPERAPEPEVAWPGRPGAAGDPRRARGCDPSRRTYVGGERDGCVASPPPVQVAVAARPQPERQPRRRKQGQPAEEEHQPPLPGVEFLQHLVGFGQAVIVAQARVPGAGASAAARAVG